VKLPAVAARHASSLAFLWLSFGAVAFLVVTARIGIISSGEGNPYGHPSPELLEPLEKEGVRIKRTVLDEAVHVLADGARLKISCFVECPEAGSVIASSMRAEIPNQKQDGEKKQVADCGLPFVVFLVLRESKRTRRCLRKFNGD
jgi:hypothetical protein